jgi:hypothetical protein
MVRGTTTQTRLFGYDGLGSMHPSTHPERGAVSISTKTDETVKDGTDAKGEKVDDPDDGRRHGGQVVARNL